MILAIDGQVGVRTGLFSDCALNCISNAIKIVQSVKRISSKSLLTPLEYSTLFNSKVKKMPNGEIAIFKDKQSSRYDRDAFRTTLDDEAFLNVFARAIKHAANLVIKIYNSAESTEDGVSFDAVWKRSNDTVFTIEVLNRTSNSTSTYSMVMKEMYFIFDMLLKHKTIISKYGDAFSSKMTGVENNPFVTEQEELKLKTIAEINAKYENLIRENSDNRLNAVNYEYERSRAVVDEINRKHEANKSKLLDARNAEIEKTKKQFDDIISASTEMLAVG